MDFIILYQNFMFSSKTYIRGFSLWLHPELSHILLFLVESCILLLLCSAYISPIM